MHERECFSFKNSVSMLLRLLYSHALRRFIILSNIGTVRSGDMRRAAAAAAASSTAGSGGTEGLGGSEAVRRTQ